MSMFQEALLLLKQPKGDKPASLQLRLFAFFALFLVVIVLLFLLLLMLFGVFAVGEKESKTWMDSELTHLYEGVDAQFGRLAVQGAAMADQLAYDAENWLEDRGASAAALQDRPELLEELLSAQSQTLLYALQSYPCTGSFIILDATVNPSLDGAAYSRAGMFFKRTEPNAIDTLSSKIHFLRGPASIARSNGIELLGQWQMEFDVKNAAFYNTVMETAKSNSRMPLSRLYYWSERMLLKGNSESAMLLCLPLIARDGTVFGVCGMEVSSMLFKRQYSPNNSRYPRVFSTLAPLKKTILHADAGLLAGNSYLTSTDAGQFRFTPALESGIVTFTADNGTDYIGRLERVKLYPSDSPYNAQAWALALMMPGADWRAAIRGNNAVLGAAILLLLLISMLVAVFISKRYIRPVVQALDAVKSGEGSKGLRTNILEIDDLLEYLSAQDATRESEQPPAVAGPDLSAYEEFVRNIATLSTAERAVFNLYMKGYTANEIAQTLWLSINTIKTHNKRIYTKLNVTSRKELMVYVQMMAKENETRAAE